MRRVTAFAARTSSSTEHGCVRLRACVEHTPRMDGPIVRVGSTQLCLRWRWLERLAFVAGGRELAASSGWDKAVRVFDVETARERACFTAQPSAIVATREGDAFVEPDGRVALYRDGEVRWIGVAHETRFATAVDPTFRFVAGSSDARTLILAPLDGGPPRVLPLPREGWTPSLVFSPDGSRVSTLQGSTLATYDIANEVELARTELAGPAWLFAAQGDELSIVTSVERGLRLELRDGATHEVRRSLELPGARAAFAAGSYALVWTEEGTVLVATADGTRTLVPAVPPYPERVAMSSDGTRFAWGYFMQPRVRLASLHGELHAPVAHTSEVTCVRFTPDGARLVSCGKDHLVTQIDLATGAIAKSTALRWLDVLPMGDHVLATSFDGVLARIERDGSHTAIDRIDAVKLTRLADGVLATGSVWDLANAPKEASIAARYEGTTRVGAWHTRQALSHGLAVCERTRRIFVPLDRSVLALDLDTGEVRGELASPPDEHALTGAIAVDADGRAYVGTYAGRVLVLEGDALRLCFDPGTSGAARSLAIVGDGVAVGDTRGMVRLVSRDGALVDAWKAHDGPVTSLDSTRDGSLLASASEDTTIAVWSLRAAASRPER